MFMSDHKIILSLWMCRWTQTTAVRLCLIMIFPLCLTHHLLLVSMWQAKKFCVIC